MMFKQLAVSVDGSEVIISDVFNNRGPGFVLETQRCPCTTPMTFLI
jgi:hypothetical protein